MTERSGAQRVAVVVGASSGVGLALARRLALAGQRVAMLARRPSELDNQAGLIAQATDAERVRAFVHDCGDLESVEPMLERIEAEMGSVDDLYFVAGVMPEVGPEEYSTEKDALQFQVNTLGCVAWCNAMAPRMIERKAGRIVAVTSVAGDRGRSGRPGYCASKAGQDAHLEAIRNRLFQHGIPVTTIRLGQVHTPMTAGLDLKGALTADQAAEAIQKARGKGRVVYVPFKWRIIMGVIKSIPSFVFRRLNIP